MTFPVLKENALLFFKTYRLITWQLGETVLSEWRTTRVHFCSRDGPESEFAHEFFEAQIFWYMEFAGCVEVEYGIEVPAIVLVNFCFIGY
jgi:hypothetical protein